MNTKLSIIIPTYLEEKLLGTLLNKFPKDIKDKYNLELIVSDGGSTDSTLDIANQFADKVVQSSATQKRSIAQGRNNGADASSSDVLIFLNADCMPENIEFFLEFITKWSDNYTINNYPIDAIACKVKSFPDEERFYDRIFYFLHNNYVRFLNFLGIGMGRGECQIVRRDIFEKVGKYNTNLIAGEDFDLYRRIKKNNGNIYYSKEIIIYESPLRFRKYGYLKTLWYWTINSLTVIFWNKSVSREWEAIR